MDEYAEEKKREHNLIVRSGKSEAEVTNDKRRRSRYSTAEANYRQTWSIARPLCDSRIQVRLTHQTSFLRQKTSLKHSAQYLLLIHCHLMKCSSSTVNPLLQQHFFSRSLYITMASTGNDSTFCRATAHEKTLTALTYRRWRSKGR